ncbi:hypothetical protein L2E82_40338 [Cichorium intybus]|uniref:Uncharacterized protein n=1 Tax=Cichorium intybus TaxID=13427 RepID=A0ACB9AKV6_CICIN|nr:hypothetical protein L2E82_40338 [Cichorium intybus]
MLQPSTMLLMAVFKQCLLEESTSEEQSSLLDTLRQLEKDFIVTSRYLAICPTVLREDEDTAAKTNA